MTAESDLTSTNSSHPEQLPIAMSSSSADVNDHANTGISSIDEAIAQWRNGDFVVVMDNEDRENEGDLIANAELVTPERIAFMLRHTTGIVCAPTLPANLQRLQLPLMVENNTELHKCKFTVTVDLKEGNSTGVSAADRARTIKAIADPSTPPEAFNRPGHIFPLLAQTGGVLVRAGHTEAAVDLARISGTSPTGYLCELNDSDGRMMRRPQLQEFAKEHGLPLVTISDLIRYRIAHETLVQRVDATKHLVTPLGQFQHAQYSSLLPDSPQRHYDVLVHGQVAGKRGVAVFLVEDGFQESIYAQWAEHQIAKEFASEGGVVIYAANATSLMELSGELMARQSLFGMSMQIVRQLEVASIVLLTTAPNAQLEFKPHGFGVEIDRVQALQCGPAQ